MPEHAPSSTSTVPAAPVAAVSIIGPHDKPSSPAVCPGGRTKPDCGYKATDGRYCLTCRTQIWDAGD
jgi:hypothetical protein